MFSSKVNSEEFVLRSLNASPFIKFKFATTAFTICWIVLESPLSFTLSVILTRELEWREIFLRQNAVMQTSCMYSVGKVLSFPVPVYFYLRFRWNWNFGFSNLNMWRDFKFKVEVSFGILWKIMVALLTIKWLTRVEKVNWSSNHVICILVGMVISTSTSAMSSSNDAISTAFIAISNSYDEISTWIV